jgi:hypothetical protein
MAQIMTPAVQDELRAFCKAFAGHRMLQPPEFTAHWRHFRDMYEQPYDGIPFATERPWFAALITHGTAEDFAALIAVNDGRCDFRDAMIRCIIQNLLEEAWLEDERPSNPVSPALPPWLRSIGAKVPANWRWNCMRRPAAAGPEEPVSHTGAPSAASAMDAEDPSNTEVQQQQVDFAAVD